METASTYFTRRARQERTNAAEAVSAEARTAHLELALRLVRIATEPALWRAWSGSLRGGQAVPREQKTEHMEDVGGALVDAFPLPAPGAFEDLLNAVDKTDRSHR